MRSRRDIGAGQRALVALATVVLLVASASLASASVGWDDGEPALTVIRTDRAVDSSPPAPAEAPPSAVGTGVPDTGVDPQPAPPAPEVRSPEPPAGEANPPSPDQPDKSKPAQEDDEDDEHEVVVPPIRDSEDEDDEKDNEGKSESKGD